MYCKQCGSLILDKAVVCVECGVSTDNFREANSALLVLGYILSFVVPVVGFIIGIYVLAKGKPGHGIGMMVLALFSVFFWMGIFSA